MASFERDVDEAIRAGHPSDGGRGVGLVDILERVDASQKWLLSHRDLDDTLRRLFENGSISEVGPRRSVATTAATDEVYRPLTEAEYGAAVHRYRDEFADTVAKVMPFLKRHAPPSVDLDGVAPAFVIERVVARFGGTIGESVGSEPLGYPVSLPESADRDAFVEAVRAALSERDLGGIDTWLMFASGDRIQVGGTG